MLTRFALDPDAVLAASASDHKRLFREWMRYGVLCHNADTFAQSELAGLIEALPQSARILWKKLLKNAWMKPSHACGLRGLEDHPDDGTGFNGKMDLACLEETRLELIQDKLCSTCPGLELGLLPDIDTSDAFEHTHELAEKRTDEMKISESCLCI